MSNNTEEIEHLKKLRQNHIDALRVINASIRRLTQSDKPVKPKPVNPPK